ncbi:MAG: hypothetical protein AAF517_03685 [Planctomycetota bacterium]
MIRSARLFFCFVALSGSFGCATQPTATPELPEDLALYHTQTLESPSPYPAPVAYSAFVSRGSKWRLESTNETGGITVVVWDGLRAGVAPAHPDADLSAVPRLDFRNKLRELYSQLNDAEYVGQDKIGKHWCWHYRMTSLLEVTDVWIDTTNSVPRQIVGSSAGAGDHRMKRVFEDLPVKGEIDERLFDIAQLKARILSASGESS